MVATALLKSASVSTAANGGVGMPSDAKNCFSASRSCDTSSARAGGNTGTRSASQRADSTGTFSNSNVTTSDACASLYSAWRSSNSPGMWSHTCAADEPEPGSSTVARTPSG